MTALAVALVLCCAMVCGTLLAWQRARDRRAVAEEVETQVSGLMEANENRRKEVADLRSEVESLRAQVALRSV